MEVAMRLGVTLLKYQANRSIDATPLKSIDKGRSGRLKKSTRVPKIGSRPAKSILKSIIPNIRRCSIPLLKSSFVFWFFVHPQGHWLTVTRT